MMCCDHSYNPALRETLDDDRLFGFEGNESFIEQIPEGQFLKGMRICLKVDIEEINDFNDFLNINILKLIKLEAHNGFFLAIIEFFIDNHNRGEAD